MSLCQMTSINTPATLRRTGNVRRTKSWIKYARIKNYIIAELYQNCCKSDYLSNDSKKNLFELKVCCQYIF